MSALTNETIQQQSSTAELYTFTIGGAVYRYTSHQQNLTETSTGNFFTAVPIKRSEYSISAGGNVESIELRVCYDGTIFESLRSATTYIISVAIDKCLVSDINDYYRMFTGKIAEIKYYRQEAIITVVGGGYELDRSVPTVFIQSMCNNQLFDGVCKLVATSYVIQGKITDYNYDWSIDYGSGGTLVIANYIKDSFGYHLSDRPQTYFENGYLQCGNEFIMIKYVSGNHYYIAHHTANAPEIGMVVYLYPGCDKMPSTCVNKFNNLTNFVGFPYIPNINPARGIKEILS